MALGYGLSRFIVPHSEVDLKPIMVVTFLGRYHWDSFYVGKTLTLLTEFGIYIKWEGCVDFMTAFLTF